MLQWGYYQLNVEGINDMSKDKTNKETPKKSKKNINYMGLLSLIVALAELATVYIMATQDNKVLWVLALVLGVDCAQRLARAFMRSV